MNPQVSIVATLDGVTTVVVAFLFVCLVFPKIVKNRPQYYAALVFIIAAILVHTLALMIQSPRFTVFAGVIIGLLQVMTILLLVLCVGGLTTRELSNDLLRSYEVLRRGETEKETIIPIGQAPIPPATPRTDDPRHGAYSIDSQSPPPPHA